MTSLSYLRATEPICFIRINHIVWMGDADNESHRVSSDCKQITSNQIHLSTTRVCPK